MKTKICSKCKKKKPFTDFSKDKRVASGRQSWCKVCRNKYNKKQRKKYYKFHPQEKLELQRKYDLKKQYGITPQDYKDLFNKQSGCCLICGKHQLEIKIRLNVDHNHKTGKIRGLLCQRCNLLVGRIENNLNLLDKILKHIGE